MNRKSHRESKSFFDFWFISVNHFIFDSLSKRTNRNDSFWFTLICHIFSIWFWYWFILIHNSFWFLFILICDSNRFYSFWFVLIFPRIMIHLRIKIKTNQKSNVGESRFTHLRIIGWFDFESKANQSESRIMLVRALGVSLPARPMKLIQTDSSVSRIDGNFLDGPSMFTPTHSWADWIFSILKVVFTRYYA